VSQPVHERTFGPSLSKPPRRKARRTGYCIVPRMIRSPSAPTNNGAVGAWRWVSRWSGAWQRPRSAQPRVEVAERAAPSPESDGLSILAAQMDDDGAIASPKLRGVW